MNTANQMKAANIAIDDFEDELVFNSFIPIPVQEEYSNHLLSHPPPLVRNGPGSNIWTENSDGSLTNGCGTVISPLNSADALARTSTIDDFDDNLEFSSFVPWQPAQDDEGAVYSTPPPMMRMNSNHPLLSHPPPLIRNGPGSNIWAENPDGSLTNRCGFVIPRHFPTILPSVVSPANLELLISMEQMDCEKSNDILAFEKTQYANDDYLHIIENDREAQRLYCPIVDDEANLLSLEESIARGHVEVRRK